VTSGFAPLEVQFTDQSTGTISSWSWNFGDGSTSNERDPVYTYTQPGGYTVSLTVTGPGGSDTETLANLIQVEEAPSAPVASFTASPTSGTSPLQVQFTDQSAGPSARGRGISETGQPPRKEILSTPMLKAVTIL